MKIPLATSADPQQVMRLHETVTGRACVVVGSAPLPTPAADVSDEEIVIAVNGGISSVLRVDVWVVASRSQDKPGHAQIKPLHKTMLQQATARTVGHVILLRGPKDASEGATLAALQQLSVRYSSWSVLDKPTKLWLETLLCARKADKPCSSGILATAAALWCGASAVRLVGFSFTPGYHYISKQRPAAWWRNHIPADQRALRALQARYGSALSGAILQQVAA